MKRSSFLLGFFLAPLVPMVFYLVTIGAEFTSYSISVVIGVYAIVLVSNQFYLASLPSWLVSKFGVKSLRALHGSSPILILLLAVLHAILKLSYGFTLSTGQAILGLVAFILFFVGTLAALFFFANTLLTKRPRFAALRSKAYERLGLTYRKARAMHNLMVVAGLVVLVHAMGASTSEFSRNPWGMSILILWMVYSLLTYANYRLTK